MSYRIKVIERSFAGFASFNPSALGGAVVKARKGKGIFTVFGEEEALRRLGYPDANNTDVYHAIEYAITAPIAVSVALGANYKYAGVDVRSGSVTGYGIGRNMDVFDPSTDYASVVVGSSYTHSQKGDGITSTFTGTIPDNGDLPIINTEAKIKIGGKVIDAVVDASGVVTGTAISGASSIDLVTGAFSLDFAGNPGTPAKYTSVIDASSGLDLSANTTNKKVTIQIDKNLYIDVDLGQSATTTQTDIINAINTAVGATTATANGNFIDVNGLVASASVGVVKLLPPTTGENAIPYVFDPNLSEIVVANSVSPSGSIPIAGQEVAIEWGYMKDLSADVSHSIFTASPFDDDFEKYAVEVQKTDTGNQTYKLTLYKKDRGVFNVVSGYQDKEYSLEEITVNGASLYYADVFDNDDYIQVVVNPDFVGSADPVKAVVELTGGKRGDDPTTIDYTTAWDRFKNPNLFKVKNFMDFSGAHAQSIRNIRDNYQTQAFAILVTPVGSEAKNNAIQYRDGLGFDWDQGSLYTNSQLIEDPYSGKRVWLTMAGKVGIKHAQMADVYDGLPPAGPDEEGRGGQLQDGFKIVRLAKDYNDFEQAELDQAQINPVLKDPGFGYMISGNRTLKIADDDTSYIHSRKLENTIIDVVVTKILSRKRFKLNNQANRDFLKTLADDFLQPIKDLGLLNDFLTQSDTANNNELVRQQRKMILDIFLQHVPDGEFLILRLTRTPQGSVLADYLQK